MNKKEIIYFDYNATAPLRPEAYEAMTNILQKPYNASAIHAYGQQARKVVEEAREVIAKLCGARPSQVIFNSGATEANNTVLQHFSGDKILISAIEHAAVSDVCPDAIKIPATKEGVVDLYLLEENLKKEKPALVSVMAVNNETGVIQPIEEIAALCKKYGALYHCDAVQAAGRIPIDITASGIDFLTLSGHKIGGPQGIGALVLGFCGQTPTLLYGGGQEKEARAGTLNAAAITGFGAAANACLNNDRHYNQLKIWRDRIEEEILNHAHDAIIFGRAARRVNNTTMFALPGITSDRVMMALDLEGIAISNGSACSSGSIEPSPVLIGMGHDINTAQCALRLSMGWDTSQKDVDRFIETWPKVFQRMNKRA